MRVTLRYFAWVRERAGRAEETVDLPAGIETVDELIGWLRTREPGLEEAFRRADVIRTAIDRKHVRASARIEGAREIAFFPPVTGG